MMDRYCLEKARWEEHLGRVELEEKTIQNAWREYQVSIMLYILALLIHTGCFYEHPSK